MKKEDEKVCDKCKKLLRFCKCKKVFDAWYCKNCGMPWYNCLCYHLED